MLLLVVGGGVLPLALVGFWLTKNAQRSGEELLRSQLDSALVRGAQELGDHWVTRRSALLRMAEDSSLRGALDVVERGGAAAGAQTVSLLPAEFDDLRGAAQFVFVSNARRTPIWILDANAAGSPVLHAAADSLRLGGARAADVVTLNVPIYRLNGHEEIGTIEARFHAERLVPAFAGSGAGVGAVIAVVDRATNAVVLPLPFDPELLRRGRFVWQGGEWLTASRQLDDPPIDLLAAAPSSAFTLPFEDAARRGLIALVLISLIVAAVLALLMRRVTKSLLELADAAESVSRGDLDRRILAKSRDEVGRVGRAFNTMTSRLQQTLTELSQRQAVAAVGEFAAALAHEIRNPLSAIRLNLQHAEEQLPNGEACREPVARALRDINRLEGTVAGALRVARTGNMTMECVPLEVPLDAAARGAAAEFARRGCTLDSLPRALVGCRVKGNGAALEQVFLNLLLNAAQACDVDCRGGVRFHQTSDAVIVTVWDTGRGFDAAAGDRVFEPFFTTKAEGTGLGLTVALRIVAAHGGTIGIESTPGVETRVLVTLPMRTESTDVADCAAVEK